MLFTKNVYCIIIPFKIESLFLYYNRLEYGNYYQKSTIRGFITVWTKKHGYNSFILGRLGKVWFYVLVIGMILPFSWSYCSIALVLNCGNFWSSQLTALRWYLAVSREYWLSQLGGLPGVWMIEMLVITPLV